MQKRGGWMLGKRRASVHKIADGRTLAVVLAVVAFAFGQTKWSGSETARAAVDQAAAAEAHRLLALSGVQGGLVVHVGCGDGRLTAALRASASYVVHGLDVDADAIRAARQHIQSLGLYGPVSVARFDGQRLPYADELVQLLVVERPFGLSKAELMRVLSPNGVLLVHQGDNWRKEVKPWPEDIDQWSHFLHDASNNAVANDRQVGPPRQLRWTCGPRWSRSHEYVSSLVAMVTAGGRLFYVFDEGPTSLTDPPMPSLWTLTARDAFSGVLLWKRRLPDWMSPKSRRALRSVPRSVHRRIVATPQRLYAALSYDGPVSVLDVATGKTLSTLKKTEGVEELLLLDGVLLAACSRQWVAAFDTEEERLLWRAEGNVVAGTPAAANGRVVYQDGRLLICRRLRDGQELWQQDVNRTPALVVLAGDLALVLRHTSLLALSATDGKPLWKVEGVGRQELFVVADRVWHWQQGHIVGRDIKTGKLVITLNTDDVFTPGHHLRCYQSKATVNYLVTPNRGAELVSLTGGLNYQNDWVRGACRYGVLPANGLLYSTPHPCFCYPGVKLTGFNALASGEPLPARQTGAADDIKDRLERGPAFPLAKKAASRFASTRSTQTAASSQEWPTYRHDPRRTGATPADVSPHVTILWKRALAAKPTAPVVADGRVFVAVPERHTVVCLDLKTGQSLWQFTADGPVDSPPTVYDGLVLFGCSDGRVYCLRAEDGELAWRFRAAPAERLIVAENHLESAWPVHGSVLVVDGVAYFAAGRSTYLDGGIWLYGLNPHTGRVLYHTRLDTWCRTRCDAEGKPFIPGYHMEGALSDILVAEEGYLYLFQYKFDRELKPQAVPYVEPPPKGFVAIDPRKEPYSLDDLEPNGQYERRQREWLERTQKDLLARLRQTFGWYSLGERHMGRHVLTTFGFLDDSWFNRTTWMYAEIWPGYYLVHRAAKSGQLLVVGPKNTYAVQAYPTRNFQSPMFLPGTKGYPLVVDRNDNEPVLDYRTFGTTKGWGYTRKEPPVWYKWLPIRVRAMALAGNHLFVAGPPDIVDPDDPLAAFQGRLGTRLLCFSADDGHTLSEVKLDGLPVFDGMAAVPGRLVLSLEQGQVVCLGGR